MKEYLDKIINEYGVSKYENIVMSGLDNFILNCSEKILNIQNRLSEDSIHNLLYILRFIDKNWLNTSKESRKTKQICLKVLFVVLLTGKKIPEWKLLVAKTVNKIVENWEIGPNDYPFLTNEERERILSMLKNNIHKSNNIATISLIFNGNAADQNDIFHFVTDKIRKDLADIYRKITRLSELHDRTLDTEYIKSIFTVICDHNLTKEFSGLLKTLPLHFSLMQLHKKLTRYSELHNEVSPTCTVSEKNITLQDEKRLFFKKNEVDSYQPVPQWAEWFSRAGQNVAAAEVDSSDHIVIGFSLPTRAYASLFFLLGYETWRSGERMRQRTENINYFEELSGCNDGEALLIFANNHWRRCWFRGTERIKGEKYIKVEVPGAERQQHINFVSKNNIPRLRKAVDPGREVAENQIGFKMTGIDSLREYYMKNENEILNLLIQEQMSYLLFANVSALKKEIEKEKLYVLSNGKYVEISFQHILRFNNFMTDFDLSRGSILSSQESIEIISNSTDMVLYDGSLAFINHQHTISGKIEVIFLDRTDSQFSFACGELMERYADREEDINLLDRQIPDSVELVVFKE